MDQIKDIYLPKWASILYAALAVVLVPWILALAEFLPARHVARHWDALWVGFDVIILFTIILTLYYILAKKIWVVVSAAALGTLFIVDAWFDILTSRPGREQTGSIIMGAIEVGLALLTFRIVYHIIHQSGHNKDVNLKTSK